MTVMPCISGPEAPLNPRHIVEEVRGLMVSISRGAVDARAL